VARLVRRLDGLPLAIELAAARVEALGVAQLADRLDDRFAVLTAGDRLAPGRHRSLAATVEWSYRLLGEDDQRVFRALSVFPGPFTLEAAEAVAGPDAAVAVLRLVDCSLLVPPREGPDGRPRYGMLETLRAYGAGLLDGAGEADGADGAAAALAGWTVQMAEEAAAGMQFIEGEAAAARRLDAEDATMRQVLAWAMDHDLPAALRLVAALGWWWQMRGRLAAQYRLLGQAAGRAEPGSDGWCAAQYWLARTAQVSGDLPAGLAHSTALRDAAAVRGPCRALADGLYRRGVALENMGRFAEAAGESRRALAVARQIGYPAGEAQALMRLGYAALNSGDRDSAVQLARQAAQITVGVPGVIARWCSYSLTVVLIGAGDLAAAEPVCAEALAWSRDTGDLLTKATLLQMMVTVDLAAGRIQDAAAHLRESLQFTRTGAWFSLFDDLDRCGHLCVATGRLAEALTVWAALVALVRRGGFLTYLPTTLRREEPLRRARQALGPVRARAAEDRGAAMSLDTAAEYALMLTDLAPPQPAATGPGALSARERELVTLVAQGRTDAQIAGQLYISIRTVRSHLDRIRDKTGCRRRADLTRLALAAGLV
jgi:DNA-binding CsgD family transcriptional regulator